MTHVYERHLARALDRMGGIYGLDDILAAIPEGRFQSFAEGDSWALTKIADFPKKRMLEILVALGDLEACRTLHDRVLQYAERNDVDLVQAYGRRGWLRDARTHGWKIKTTAYLYQRSLR